VSHTDPEILALRALGETAGTDRDDEHAATCARCRAEQARLTELVSLARTGGAPEPLVTPPPRVWDQIAAAVAEGGSAAAAPAALATSEAHGSNGAAQRVNGNGSQDGTGNQDGRPAEPGPAEPGAVEASPVEAGPVEAGPAEHGHGGRSLRGQRRKLAGVVAGLAAGLIIGIGGTAGVVQLTKAPPTRTVAHVELTPLPQYPQWQGSSGTAVMQTSGGQQEMAVTLVAPVRSGFYEVWLLARDGVSMISLGELNADLTGTFTIPAGTDLRNYSRIDISLQPFDGSTAHAKASVVRGSLPATALADGRS
jgi:hypothetical protein